MCGAPDPPNMNEICASCGEPGKDFVDTERQLQSLCAVYESLRYHYRSSNCHLPFSTLVSTYKPNHKKNDNDRVSWQCQTGTHPDTDIMDKLMYLHVRLQMLRIDRFQIESKKSSAAAQAYVSCFKELQSLVAQAMRRGGKTVCDELDGLLSTGRDSEPKSANRRLRLEAKLDIAVAEASDSDWFCADCQCRKMAGSGDDLALHKVNCQKTRSNNVQRVPQVDKPSYTSANDLTSQIVSTKQYHDTGKRVFVSEFATDDPIFEPASMVRDHSEEFDKDQCAKRIQSKKRSLRQRTGSSLPANPNKAIRRTATNGSNESNASKGSIGNTNSSTHKDSKSGSTSDNKKPARDEKHNSKKTSRDSPDLDAIKFTFFQSLEHAKKNTVTYCLAWSELYTGVISEKAVSTASSHKTVRYLAACSNRIVCVYNVNVFPSNRKKIGIKKGAKFHPYGSMEVLQSYEDAAEDESYYSCTFAGRTQMRLYPAAQLKTKNESRDALRPRIENLPSAWESYLRKNLGPGPQLLCVGGERRIIQVIDTVRQQVVRSLLGHGDAIFDLKVSPTDEWLLLSASKDRSCRLWNLRTGSNLAVFGGHAGHLDSVNSISWHSSGKQFATGSMDTTIKIWQLTSKVEATIATSHFIAAAYESNESHIEQYVSGPAPIEQLPIFSTRKAHTHCVDCVHFLGDLMLSKSTENLVQLWLPDMTRTTTVLNQPTQPSPCDLELLRTFELEDANIWFVRFAVEPKSKTLAAGNIHGVVYLWTIGAPSSEPFRKLTVTRPSSIRYLSFSPDGAVLIASTDDGVIHRWNTSLFFEAE